MKMRLVYLIFILASLATFMLAGLLPEEGLAQVEDGGATATPIPEEIIPEQDLPGDTTILLFAAAVLVVIAVIGVFWRNSIVSKGDPKHENPNEDKNL